jgi:heptosyltransferase-2
MKRILVIRKHNHLGDMLCSLPLYAALRARWSDARIDLLAAPTAYPVPLAEINPYLHDILFLRKDGPLALPRLLWRIRQRRYDMVIVPSTIRHSRSAHLIARASGAPMRVGVRSYDGVANPDRAALTHAIDTRWSDGPVHQLWRNLAIAEAAGCAPAGDPLAMRIPVSAAAVAEAGRVLAALPADGPIVGVHVGAGKRANVWPAGRFVATLRALRGDGPLSVLLTAGAMDADEVEAVERELRREGIPLLLLRDAPIPLLSAVLRRLALYLCNDTGTMHVAAFSGAPVLALFGPTPAAEWAPLQARCRAIVSPDASMKGISVYEVLDAGRAMLAAWRERRPRIDEREL